MKTLTANQNPPDFQEQEHLTSADSSQSLLMINQRLLRNTAWTGVDINVDNNSY